VAFSIEEAQCGSTALFTERRAKMKGSKILLVDDEVVFTNNMAKLLTNRGYKVTAVNSGDAAIRALQDQTFDVMVLDLKMPGMDGITTLRQVEKLGIFTETLILTGHGSIDTALEAIKLGAYDYLTKPCEIGELVAKIEGAWSKKSDAQKGDAKENNE
jgi:DNA-binding NtrC family response regulator